MCEKTGVLIALGTFDGLHLGHRAVLNADRGEYKRKTALLFREHPAKVLTGEAPGELITFSKRDALLKSLGYDIEFLSFSEIAGLSPRDFVEKVLIEKYGATALVCGFNYRFGRAAEGDVELLKRLCAENEIKLTVCDEIDFEGKPISSTRIRNCLKNGDITSANKMLGRDYSYDFRVVHGDARGRILGSPTINQFFKGDFLAPQNGVYASYTVVDGKKYVSVTNVGVRPTIEGSVGNRSETNIIDFKGDLYDKNIEVFLVERLRGEMTFPSLDELSKQIYLDRERAKELIKL